LGVNKQFKFHEFDIKDMKTLCRYCRMKEFCPKHGLGYSGSNRKGGGLNK